jgi:4-amino-4-deoxy-L-arabinose transferase-like glycosyltransferase
VAWLLPAALVLLAAGLWFTRRAARTDPVRASLVLWGTWLLITAAVFSFMSGTIHAYYTIELAPAISAIIGIAGVQLWKGRSRPAVRAVLIAAILLTAVWSFFLLSSDPTWLPWLRWTVLALGVLSAAFVGIGPARTGRAGAVVMVSALLSAGLGPGAWTVATAATGHTGGTPTSGPAPGTMDRTMGLAGNSQSGGFTRGGASRRPADFPERDNSQAAAAPAFAGFGETPDNPALNALLQNTTTQWAAATVGANSAAGLELGSNTSVMAIGGFSGSDPFPTLDQFKQMVADGKITYFVPGNGFGGAAIGGSDDRGSSFGGSAGPTVSDPQNPGTESERGNTGDQGRAGRGGPSSAITQWVEATFPAIKVGDATVYQFRP